jgi:protein-L-isoaspartate(D-aspartate) O-methyltransferase
MCADSEAEAYIPERERMVGTQLRARGIRDERVLTAMTRVPRHEFVPSEFRLQAYEDHPLPIGQDQTISQPYMVALMLEYLAVEPENTVLEIGTGSGYQSALLAELAKRVYTIERHLALANFAARDLMRLGYSNVTVLVRDGSHGLPEHAPYERIIVSAAAPRVPPALLAQLSEGGRMILPVGSEHVQELQLIRKKNGMPLATSLEGCRFVPLIVDDP